MTKPTLTIVDVREAIEVLKQQGVADPGVHRIRTYLGKGSVSTINRYKHQLRAAEREQLRTGPSKPLPDPLSDLAAQLWNELHKAVEAVEAEQEQATAAALSEKQQALEAVQATLAGETARADHLQRELEAMNYARRELSAELDKVRAKFQNAQHTLALRDQAIAHLTERVSQVHSDFVAHSQQAVIRETELKREVEAAVAERQTERKEAEAIRARLQEQVAAWQKQFEQQHKYFEAQVASRDQQLGALRQDVRVLADEKGQLFEALQQAKARVHELDLQAQTLTEGREELRRARDVAVEALQRAQAQHTEERAGLERTFTELRETITALRQQQLGKDSQ